MTNEKEALVLRLTKWGTGSPELLLLLREAAARIVELEDEIEEIYLNEAGESR